MIDGLTASRQREWCLITVICPSLACCVGALMTFFHTHYFISFSVPFRTLDIFIIHRYTSLLRIYLSSTFSLQHHLIIKSHVFLNSLSNITFSLVNVGGSKGDLLVCRSIETEKKNTVGVGGWLCFGLPHGRVSIQLKNCCTPRRSGQVARPGQPSDGQINPPNIRSFFPCTSAKTRTTIRCASAQMNFN